MNTPLLLVLGAAALLTSGQGRTQESDTAMRAAAEHVAIGTCAACHGPQGHSYSPRFPVLAGQQRSYLIAQLQGFKAQSRGDPDAIGYMWGMAAPLGDDMIDALADYYSRQTPTAGPRTKSGLLERGEAIYQNGDSAQGVPPCAACHGPAAAGTASFPRLAGQHRQYLMKQLHSFQNNMRNVAVMHGVARGLQQTDMEAVATYLQSLGPSQP